MSSGLPGWPSVTPEGPICASDRDTIPFHATPKARLPDRRARGAAGGRVPARLLSKWADLALTSNNRIEPTVAKFLSNIIRYTLWAVVGFVGTEAYTKFLLRGNIIE
jgi:hypothetical protein